MRPELEGLVLLSLGVIVLTVSVYALGNTQEPLRFPETDNPSLCDRLFTIISGVVAGTAMAGMGALKFRRNERVKAALGLVKKAEKYLEEGSERIPAKYNALTYVLRALKCVKSAAALLEEVERELEESEREGGKEEKRERGEREEESEREREGEEDVRAAEGEGGAGRSGGGDGDRGERGSADDRRRGEAREVSSDGGGGAEGREREEDRGGSGAG